MKINNDIKELILEYVGRYFRHEKDFYTLEGVKFTDANWQKFKNGDTSIEKMGAGRVSSMLHHLFESYELTLISKAQTKYYFSNSWKMTMSFPAFYDMFKKEHLLKWLKESPKDVIGGTGRIYLSNGNMIANAYLEVALESSDLGEGNYLAQMRFKNYSKDPKLIPSGRENRLTWIEENLENIR